MALSQFQNAGQWTDDATFRAFGTAFRAALTAAGFVRTSDTGQIDWTTVTRMATTNTAAGYEIWRFNDTAQTGQPIFFKLEYGTGATASVRPSFWVTTGTGSNGSGTITGTLCARSQAAVSAHAATPGDVWVAGGDGYLAAGIFAGAATATNATFFVIERLRATDGTVDTTSTGAGILQATHVSGSPTWIAAAYDGAWTETNPTAWPSLAAAAPAGTTGLYRGTVYAFPYYPIVGTPRGPSRAAIMAFANDAPASAPFSLSLYSATHTFRAPGSVNAAYGRGGSPVAAVRYE